MTRHPALASGFSRFLACPLVGRALLMGGLATLTGNFALLRAVHRGESAILFSHTNLLPPLTARLDSLRSLCASRSNAGFRVRTVGLQRGCHGSSGNLGNPQQ